MTIMRTSLRALRQAALRPDVDRCGIEGRRLRSRSSTLVDDRGRDDNSRHAAA
jgi:hypothetical protein